MHIMEIVSATGFNGGIYHCQLLVRELVARGHQITLVCLPGARIAKNLEGEPIRIVRSDLHRWPADELRRIAALARDSGVEVVHTHLSRANFFGVLLRFVSGIPCVATAHRRRFQLHWMFNDLVIAVSDAVRRYHRRYNFVRSGRIVTIRNFIDQRRFAAPAEATRAKIRAELGIDEGACLIGAVGAIYPEKGLKYLVEALGQIAAEAPQASLLLVGREPVPSFAEQLRSAARAMGLAGRIHWAGHRDDIPEMLQAMDIFVQPSLEEALGMSILEAMAARLPVVGTDIGGIPECIGHERTGTLVPPAQSDALAEAILDLLHDPEKRCRYGQTGLAVFQEQFSAASLVPQIEEALATTARRARPAKAA